MILNQARKTIIPLLQSLTTVCTVVSTEAPPLESASQQIELLPLLSDPDASVPENELIERDFQAMEEEHRQVASLANAK